MAEMHSSQLFQNLTILQALDAMIIYHEQFHNGGNKDLVVVENSSGRQGVLHICIDRCVY